MSRRLDFAAASVGVLLLAGALGIIWGARWTVPRDLYVSELGAEGEPTAEWFRGALLLIVAGSVLIGWAGRSVRSAAPILSLWTPSVSLWIGAACFLVASQVTCTSGCPLPVGDTFTVQDFVHTLAAVLAFAAGCWAMLQASFTRGRRALSLFSLISASSVAVIAATGGILSLLEWQAEFGSRLELVATTIGLLWILVFGTVLAVRARADAAVDPAISTPVEAAEEERMPLGR